jgi:hypothetical protein
MGMIRLSTAAVLLACLAPWAACGRSAVFTGDGLLQEPVPDDRSDDGDISHDESVPDTTEDIAVEPPDDEPSDLDLEADEPDGPVFPAWAKTYGGPGDDYLRSIAKTSDGGFVAAGWSDVYAPGRASFWVLKLDGEGGIEWQMIYDIPHDIIVTGDVVQTTGGSYVVTGNSWNWTRGYILGVSAGGDLLWASILASGLVFGLAPTGDGGCAVVGATTVDRINDAWVLKLDASGNAQWEMAYGNPYFAYGESIDSTADGGYIVTAHNDSYEGLGEGSSFWILGLDAWGAIRWQRIYNIGFYAYSSMTEEIEGGKHVFSGWYEGGVWTMKLGGGGGIEWQKTYVKNFQFPHVTPLRSGDGFIISGAEPLEPHAHCISLFRVDAEGNPFWERHYGGEGENVGGGLVETEDGGLVLVGGTQSAGAGLTDGLILKLDPAGNISPTCLLNMPVDAPLEVTETSVEPEETAVIGVPLTSAYEEPEILVSETFAEVRTICSAM